MKRFAVLTALVLGFGLMAAAHPPTEIIITIDVEKGLVNAEIMHGSKDIKDHFVHEVELYVNGVKMIKQTTVTQTDGDKLSVVYRVPGLKAGDKVAVMGDCSKFGELKKETEAKAPEKVKTQKNPKAKAK